MRSLTTRITTFTLLVGIASVSVFGVVLLGQSMQDGYCIASVITGSPCAANSGSAAVHHLTAIQSFFTSVLPTFGMLALFLSTVFTFLALSLFIFHRVDRAGIRMRPPNPSHSLHPYVLRWLALHENSPTERAMFPLCGFI
ncbi:MAG TPA: hypothetical protein VMV38_00695 [Candidatus Paceibacterota bacterium]|nr:hypothetical protein [Candidatus Paceibacterota bacterium]